MAAACTAASVSRVVLLTNGRHQLNYDQGASHGPDPLLE